MEVVVLIELDAGTAAANAALRQRVSTLTLKGQARLNFVAADTSTGVGSEPAQDVVALSLPSQEAACSLLAQWRLEGIIAAAAPVRILRLQPFSSMEPFALMFP